MTEIVVDGEVISAEPGELLIAACERNGVYIPRFCYHPRMSPVGMCRMCLVEVDTGRGPSLQPSCMLESTPQMKVNTESESVKKAQDGVLEFLLINHPLDCPVCDKGGECPLQDQTMAYGPGETRFVEDKRHFAKPISISETVYLDRERCILCDRCTRFADEVAGDTLIHFMGRGNHTEINTFPDMPFSSYFSGNTVQICPVGALTAVPYRFKARPWDLTEAVSTAWVDSLGARIAVQASRNRVLRVLGVDADSVNWGWLSDKERFGFEALNSPERLHAPMVRGADSADSADSGEFKTAGWGEAMDRVCNAIAAAPPERVAVLGGARLTNEAQYMWAKLAKGVIGTDNVDAQLGDGIDPRLVLGLPGATIDEACRPGGTVVWIGPDPKEELGTLYLRLRHAIVNDAVTLIEITPQATGLSRLAAHSLHPQPGNSAHLSWHLARQAAAKANGAPIDASDTADHDSPLAQMIGVEAGEFAGAVEALAAAASPVTVVVGQASLAEPAEEIARAALAFACFGHSSDGEQPAARFLPALRRGNLRGAMEMGLAPGLLPGRVPLECDDHTLSRLLIRQAPSEGADGVDDVVSPDGADDADDADSAVSSGGADDVVDNVAVADGASSGQHTAARSWPRTPSACGLDARGILEAAATGDVDVLVLVGADPVNDFIDRDLAVRGLRGAGVVVAIDLFVNDSAMLAADVVLAAAAPTECDGTFTNLEGRISVMSHKVTAAGTARPDWMIAVELAERLEPGSARGLDSPEAIRAELATVSRAHRRLSEESLAASPREGVLLSSPEPLTPTMRQDALQSLLADHEFEPERLAARDPAEAQDCEVAQGDSQPLRLFRLVASRRMYDDGVMMRHCSSLKALIPAPTARINPADMAHLTPAARTGAAEESSSERDDSAAGDDITAGLVRVTSRSGHIVAALQADDGVPAGVLAVDWLAPGAATNSLITAGQPVTFVRVERQ